MSKLQAVADACTVLSARLDARAAQRADAEKPTLEDLREGRVTSEAFLASRNNYQTKPTKTRAITVPARKP